MPPSAIGNSFVLISPPDCPLYLNNLDLGDGPKYFLHLYKLQFIQCNNTGHNCQRFLGRTQKYMWKEVVKKKQVYRLDDLPGTHGHITEGLCFASPFLHNGCFLLWCYSTFIFLRFSRLSSLQLLLCIDYCALNSVTC